MPIVFFVLCLVVVCLIISFIPYILAFIITSSIILGFIVILFQGFTGKG